MLCPHCSTDNASAFGYCSSCGKPLSTINGAPPPPPLGSRAAAGAAPALAPRQAKRKSTLVVVGSLAVVALIVVLGFGLPALNNGFESPDQYVGRLMREAAGQQPVRNPLFPGARRRDTILRDQFRKVIQVNRDYMEAVNNTDISEVKKINSPESFVDPNYAAPALQQLHAVYALDSNQEEKVKDILTNM